MYNLVLLIFKLIDFIVKVKSLDILNFQIFIQLQNRVILKTFAFRFAKQ